MARQLGLEVTEVSVQALERQGSKVQMVADALAMLGEVWDVRRTRTNPVGGEVGPCLHPRRRPSLLAIRRLPQWPARLVRAALQTS